MKCSYELYKSLVNLITNPNPNYSHSKIVTMCNVTNDHNAMWAYLLVIASSYSTQNFISKDCPDTIMEKSECINVCNVTIGIAVLILLG